MDYTPHRSDRIDRTHGGVITFIHNSVACDAILNFSDKYCSLLIIKIIQKNLVLINIYRPPDCPENSFKEVMNRVRATCESLEDPIPDIIMLGDFNFPRITWPAGSIGKGGTISEQNQSKYILKLSDDLFLTQYILKPTRAKSILDLVFTNNNNLIYNYEVTPTIYSDHNILDLTLNYQTQSQATSNPNPKSSPYLSLLNFHSAEWTKINLKLNSINWDVVFKDCDLQQKVKLLNDKIEEVCSQTIPPKPQRSKKLSIIPRDRRIMMRKRGKLRNQMKQARSTSRERSIFLKIHKIEKALHDSYTCSRQSEETKAINVIKENPKHFYAFAKKYSTTKVDIGPFMDESKNIVSSNFGMAEMLRNQYNKAFSTPDLDKVVENPGSFFRTLDYSKPTLTDFNFSPGDIIKAIDQLNLTSAPGPDAVPTSLLKNCKNTLAIPLYKIWKHSLDEGEIGEVFKSAMITPIHKGGSRAHPQNYRPISLTSHVIKIFERVIREKLVNFLERNNLMNPTQHGFRSGRSCLSQLLEHYDKILAYLEQGLNVDVIYLDFAKAFDKVDHGILCHKLREIGIGGKVGVWLHNFLNGRKQVVAVNNSVSLNSPVQSGVPQGTVLGPVLFLIFILDINNGIHSGVSSFADDTRITGPVRTPKDVDVLQCDLFKLYNWQSTNNMLFNDNKFEVLRYGKNMAIKEETNYVTPNGIRIVPENTVKDLGVIMNNSATFNDHIDHKTLKAKNLISWILRTFSARDSITMMTLWKSLVQPHLDYCSQLWSPTKLGEVEKLESLQRSFTNRIDGLSSKNYWQRLSILRTNSQCRRQERYIIIYAWKILENKVPNPGLKSVHCPRKGRLLKIPEIVKSSPCYVKTIKESSFCTRAPRLFNLMPLEIRNLTECSVDCFKNKLDKHLSKIPDEPRISGYTSFCRGSSNRLNHMIQFRVDTDADLI